MSILDTRRDSGTGRATAPVEQPQRQPLRSLPRLGLGRRSGGISVAVMCLLVGALVLPPLVTVVIRSFTETDLLGNAGSATLENYRALVDQPGLRSVVFNTLVSSLGAAVLSIVLGGGLAWVVERTNAPGAGACRLVMLLSLATPYVLYAIAWIMILGPDGPVNGPLVRLFGLESAPLAAYSLWTMMFVEGLIAVPLAFLFLSAVLRSVDASLEEGAAVAGAGPLRVLRRITGPLMLPGIAAVALLVFIRTLEAFEIPALIGLPGNVRVMTTSIFLDTKEFPPDYGSAGAYAIILMLGVGGLLYLSNRLNKRADAFATVTGKSTRPRRVDLHGKKWIGTAVIAAYCTVAFIAPLAIIVWASLMPYYTPPTFEALPLATVGNYDLVLGQSSFLSSLRNTVVVGAASASVIVVIAAVSVWLSARRRARGGELLEQLAMTPLIVPGVIMGFAIAALYIALPLPVYGTLLILVVGYVTRFLPYGMRYASAGMIQVHSSLEEAAAVSGATNWRTLWRVLLPLCRPALIAAWVFIFLVASKELSMAVLLATPGQEVLSVILYQQWNNGQITQAAAVGVLYTLVTGLLMTVFLFLTQRGGVRIDA